MNGKIFFTIGGYEINGFQNKHLEHCKYMGRFKTKEKYLAALFLFNVWLYNNDNLISEVDFEFFKKYSDYIIVDVFFIEDERIINTLDLLGTKSMEVIIKMEQLKNGQSKSNFFETLQKMKEQGQDLSKLLN
jgi:hypothetical protein